MDELILAGKEPCSLVDQAVCAPVDILHLFEFREAFITVLGFPVTRTVILIFLAAAISIAVIYFGLRKRAAAPGKYQLSIETMMLYVRDEIAIAIIGPKGIKYFPYLMSLFIFILVGNFFKVTPLINMPITSRMSIPLFLALLTWVVFIFAGLKRNGIGYFTAIVWPPGVPIAFKPAVGVIEFFSTFFVRPFSLAVRLFANLVAGHLMLSMLMMTAFVSFATIDEIGLLRGMLGIGWWVLAIGIFFFELIVILLQAYIFTLLSAVYIDSSVNAEH